MAGWGGPHLTSQAAWQSPAPFLHNPSPEAPGRVVVGGICVTERPHAGHQGPSGGKRAPT